MLDKNKIIIVIYVGTYDYDDTYCLELSKVFENYFDDSVKLVFIIDKFSSETRIECINPVLCNENQWAKIEQIIKKTEQIIEKTNKDINNGRN